MAGEGHSFGSLVEEVNTKARTDSTVPNRTQLAQGVDLNTLTTLGFCDGNALINAPAGVGTGWCYIFTQSHSALDAYRYQVCTAFLQSGISGTWTRQMIANVWQPWVPDKTGEIAEIMRQLANKAEKATTLTGYGIADAYDKTAMDAALALKAPKKQPVFEGLVTTSPAVAGALHDYGAAPAIRLQPGEIPQGAFAPALEQASVTPGIGYTTFLRFGTTRKGDPTYMGAMGTISLSGEGNLALAAWHFRADGYLHSRGVLADVIRIADPNAARADQTRDFNGVSTLLRWNNCGNNHVIFDASQGVSPSGVMVGNIDAITGWLPTLPVLMGWNGTTTSGVRVDSARNAEKLGERPASEYATVAAMDGKAAKASTLAGYGITDAYTRGAANDLFAARTDPTIAGTKMSFSGGTLRVIPGVGLSLDTKTHGFMTGLRGQHMCANRYWDSVGWHVMEPATTSSYWGVARDNADLNFYKGDGEAPSATFQFNSDGLFTCYKTTAQVVKVTDMSANIADQTRDFNGVSTLLRWNNCGNNHVIFDASQGVSPSGVMVGNTDATTGWLPTLPVLMGWNGTTTSGVRVDSARNADCLGGLDPSAFQYSGTKEYSNLDLNNIRESGRYKGTNMGNAPDAGGYYIDVSVHTGDTWQLQTATPFGASASPLQPTHSSVQKYVRRLIEGKWTPWQGEGAVIEISNADLNTYLGTGTYIGQGLLSAPGGIGGYMYVQVIGHSGGLWCTQTVTPYGHGSTSGINTSVQYVRRFMGGDWENWSEVGNCPIGTLLSWPGDFVPIGYIGAFGNAIDPNIYPRLAQLYGARLPDMRAYFVSYADKGRGLIYGQGVLQAQPGRVGAHTHTTPGQVGDFFQYSGGGGSAGIGVPYQAKGVTGPVQQAGDFISELNYPNNVAFMPIIRAG